MTMHMEWDTAAECGATIYTREAALQEFGSDLDDVIAAPYVLALGGNGGGALGIAGTREDLIKLGVDIKEAASKLPDVRS